MHVTEPNQPLAAINLGGSKTPDFIEQITPSDARSLQLPSQSNWITYAGIAAQVGSSIVSFRSTWTVPESPSIQDEQLLYLFNGLQPSDSSFILQPVLQWGDSGEDEDGVQRTGRFWTIGSWSVGEHSYHTPHLRVNAGEKLVGTITLTAHNNGRFDYACEFEGRRGTLLLLTGLPALTWGGIVLEAYETQGTYNPPYDLKLATEYPPIDRTEFTEISIASQGNAPLTQWASYSPVTQYGEHCVVRNSSLTNGQIDLFYRAGQ